MKKKHKSQMKHRPLPLKKSLGEGGRLKKGVSSFLSFSL